MNDQTLMELAVQMLERSYAPYSHFPVGSHLEYADDATLMRALEGRREI